jgi:hypothetical protein
MMVVDEALHGAAQSAESETVARAVVAAMTIAGDDQVMEGTIEVVALAYKSALSSTLSVLVCNNDRFDAHRSAVAR